jgi:hypothetical protein
MIAAISVLIQLVYICVWTKSRNAVFLILSLLHQRQNIFELKLNVQDGSSSWCYGFLYFNLFYFSILCNRVMLQLLCRGWRPWRTKRKRKRCVWYRVNKCLVAVLPHTMYTIPFHPSAHTTHPGNENCNVYRDVVRIVTEDMTPVTHKADLILRRSARKEVNIAHFRFFMFISNKNTSDLMLMPFHYFSTKFPQQLMHLSHRALNFTIPFW